MLLTKKQQQILIGTILGDGHLENNGRGARLRVDHTLKQEDYVRWKHAEFGSFVTAKPRVIRSFHKTSEKFYERLHFSTFSSDVFLEWKNLFYKNKKKIIPKNIQSILTSPLSLAVWYMDDGYKRNDCNALRLNTDLFSIAEQQLLSRCLKKNFGIDSKIHKKGKSYCLYVPQKSSKKFCELVRPYMVDSLLYKVSLTP